MCLSRIIKPLALVVTCASVLQFAHAQLVAPPPPNDNFANKLPINLEVENKEQCKCFIRISTLCKTCISCSSKQDMVAATCKFRNP